MNDRGGKMPVELLEYVYVIFSAYGKLCWETTEKFLASVVSII